MTVSLLRQTNKYFTKTLPEYVVKNNSGFLATSFAVTSTLSALAQVGAVTTNEKLPKHEKSFVVEQELSLGILTCHINNECKSPNLYHICNKL